MGREVELYRTRPSLWLSIAAWGSAFTTSLLIYHLGFQLLILLVAVWPLAGQYARPWWVGVAMTLPWAGAFWYALEIYCTKYVFTNQRLIVRRGVLSTRQDEIEVSRFRDFRIVKPFSLRIMGLGDLIVFSADQNMPQFVIRAQRDVEALRDELRLVMQERQNELGYREYEVT